MNYDDFSLPQNWENLARAYSENLKNKGFVFVRIDDNKNIKLSHVNKCHQLLSQTLAAYQQISKKVKGAQGANLSKIQHLTENTLKQFESFYPSTHLNTTSNINQLNMFNILPTIISLEAKLVKNTLQLLEHEDDMEKHVVIKNNLFLRLDLLKDLG